MTDLPRIGFAGLGIMGAPMAGHLLAAGYRVAGYNRSRSARTEELQAKGLAWADSPAALAADSDIIITMLGFPSDVETVWGEGLLPAAKPGTLLIDMTTSSPSLARRLADAAAAKGCAALDAPVSGGDVGARNATLSIMAGGDEAAFARALPECERMGQTLRRIGGPGAGPHCKMANQFVIASTVMGTAEGLSYARAAGLDATKVLEAIGPGAASSFQLNVLGPKMLAGDFAPGFMVKHFLKDLGIALDEAAAMDLDLPGLKQARALFEMLRDAKGGEVGTQAIIAAYARG